MMRIAPTAAEIRDPIHGYIYPTELEKSVIDTPVFQRLRRIRQLAGAHLTYPGGQHSRFEHLVGAMHLAGKACETLAERTSFSVDDVKELRLAGLLHDVGHGPYSHLFEEVMSERRNVTHEDMTVRIIRETELRDILSAHGIDAVDFSPLAIGLSERKPRFMNDVIGGGLSIDTMDYLLRDSYFTGVEYGKVDVHRIIDAYEVADGRLALDRAALYAFEALMIARYEMFRAVYFHRTVRSAELMLVRAMTLADDTLGLTDLRDLEKYLYLTDEVTLASLIDLDPAGNSQLKRARELAISYRDRRLLKCVFEEIVQRKDRLFDRIFSQRSIRDQIANEMAKEADVDAEEVYVDVPTTPSVPLTSARQTLSEITLVSKSNGESKYETIGLDQLPLVNAISGYMDILRVYTTEDNREKVEKAAKSFFATDGFATRISM